jgi:hypothetical protein
MLKLGLDKYVFGLYLVAVNKLFEDENVRFSLIRAVPPH